MQRQTKRKEKIHLQGYTKDRKISKSLQLDQHRKKVSNKSFLEKVNRKKNGTTRFENIEIKHEKETF